MATVPFKPHGSGRVAASSNTPSLGGDRPHTGGGGCCPGGQDCYHPIRLQYFFRKENESVKQLKTYPNNFWTAYGCLKISVNLKCTLEILW